MPDSQNLQDFHANFTGGLSSDAQSHPLFAQLQSLASDPAMQNSAGLAQYQALQAQLMAAVPQAIQPKPAADQPAVVDASTTVAQAPVAVTTPVAAAAAEAPTTLQAPASADATTVVNVKCGDVKIDNAPVVAATGGESAAVAAPTIDSVSVAGGVTEKVGRREPVTPREAAAPISLAPADLAAAKQGAVIGA
jgi:hypothetical protein